MATPAFAVLIGGQQHGTSPRHFALGPGEIVAAVIAGFFECDAIACGRGTRLSGRIEIGHGGLLGVILDEHAQGPDGRGCRKVKPEVDLGRHGGAGGQIGTSTHIVKCVTDHLRKCRTFAAEYDSRRLDALCAACEWAATRSDGPGSSCCSWSLTPTATECWPMRSTADGRARKCSEKFAADTADGPKWALAARQSWPRMDRRTCRTRRPSRFVRSSTASWKQCGGRGQTSARHWTGSRPRHAPAWRGRKKPCPHFDEY